MARFRLYGLILSNLILLAFFLSLPLLLAGFSGQRSKGEVYQLLEKGNYLEAILKLRETRKHFDDPLSQLDTGKMLANIFSLYLKDYGSAAEELSRALTYAANPEDKAELRFLLGMVNYQRGKYDQALEFFRSIITDLPQSTRRQNAELMSGFLERRTGNLGMPLSPQESSSPFVRVLLKEDVVEAKISSPKGVYLGQGGGKAALVSHPLVIKAEDEELYAGSIRVSPPLTLSPVQGFISVNGASYRGSLEIDVHGARLRVINIVNLEDYLKGVVPKEVPHHWNFEALKAQAVAARTFALSQLSSRQDQAYHLNDTVDSQVYGGVEAETPNTNRAVEETAGEIISYQGKPIVAYFHANSGGITAGSKQVWGIELPYLRTMRDPYSEGVQTSRWEAVFTGEKIRSSLQSAGYRFGKIEKIFLKNPSPSGRFQTVVIHHDQGILELNTNTFREIMGSMRIKSNFFDISQNEDDFTFRGRGLGHGVGMSQWGANRMAEVGKNYRQILSFYYQGVSIKKFF